ncbi:LytTR family DNA-binding domain-containing protein [Pseudoxanthomonas sp. SGT-18]|uniref:LytR/AlgR family response regulator transcription factor n=1 Tax=Pseudoxanthomonas sp. SGT-18 TaxID=2493087 RepID=UPI0019814952|nr:LytTR family DNA-binding domain-containing protein [Pseudoxanthomonas sp. SGT-18]
MHNLKLVIADDEPMARERLRMLLSENSGVDVVAEAGDGDQVLDACAAHRPHAVLLDIAMPGMDGLETARRLAEANPATAVVFCTAYDAHALSAFEVAAIDYLVKPVRPERLAVALERVRTFLAGRPVVAPRRTQLCARLRGSLRVIPLEDVYYLQAEEKYVVVHHARGQDLIEESLKSLEEEFGDMFVRIHRSCLVARRELLELRRSPDGQVRAILRHGGPPLEVSRRCVPQLRQTLQ